MAQKHPNYLVSCIQSDTTLLFFSTLLLVMMKKKSENIEIPLKNSENYT